MNRQAVFRVIARSPSAEFTLSEANVLRVYSVTKQSDGEYVISSPSTRLRMNSTRNPDVSRAFDMTNERQKRLLRGVCTEEANVPAMTVETL